MNHESHNTTGVPITLDKVTLLPLSHTFLGAIGLTAGKGVTYLLSWWKMLNSHFFLWLSKAMMMLANNLLIAIKLL